MFGIKGCSLNQPALLLLLLCSFTTIGAITSTRSETIHTETAELDFSLPGIDGERYHLSHLRGKVVLITFCASWCQQCIEEMPQIEALWRDADQHRCQVLAINVGEEADMILKFRQRLRLSFPLLLDQGMTVYKRWPLLGLPTSFLLNRQGAIVHKVVGYMDWNDARIKSLIETL